MNKHGSCWIFMILVKSVLVQSCPSASPYFFRRPGDQVEIKLTTTINTNKVKTYQIWNGNTRYVSVPFYNGFIYDETEVNCPMTNCELSGNVSNGIFIITLLDLQATTAGTFQLKEINDNVIASCSTLFIIGPPNTPTISSNKDPFVGETVTVTCKSTSTTTPSNHGLRMLYNWTISGQINPVEPRYTYSASRNQIDISNVRKTDNVMVMKCSATEDVNDGYTSETSSFTLNVVYGPDVTMINATSPFIVTEGFTTSDVACTSDCWPECTNKWYNDTSNVIITNKGRLSLGRPNRSQAGNYTCVAENTIAQNNKHTSATLEIVVHYPPDVHVDSENATSDDKVIFLKCIAKGVPNHYTYNNWEQRWIGSNLVRNWPSKGLSVLNLKDLTYEHSGVYTCSASNGVPGSPNAITDMQASAYIFIKENANDMSDYTVRIKNDFKQTMLLIDVKPEGPPTIPTQFALNNVDQNAIEASWLAEFNGGFRQTFVIQISIDEIHWSNASIRTEDTDRSNDIYRLTISNLDHSTTYFLRLYAFNELGLSGFTSVLQATTSDTQDHASKGALIGGIVGGCTSMIIAVLVASLLLWRRRRAIPKEVENPMCVEAESTITQTPSFAHATSRGETRTERTTIDDLYAVVDKNAKTSGIYTNCSGEPNDKRQGSTKLINHAGLVYADVVFDKPALEQEQFTIHGLEDRTEYAQVDLAI
ncbi:uncharacterized protein LOC128233735 isoform X2 [Mya arenaria]|uniref:uncharacterized protein LOC128233735 isoform X2 n=1 Tax=Mya arenaria TaxID=6604 RepID=UPI0022E434E4|nr:uncharacterized protein LOC128233735 isoform X2 [Mya arenaria]